MKAIPIKASSCSAVCITNSQFIPINCHILISYIPVNPYGKFPALRILRILQPYMRLT